MWSGYNLQSSNNYSQIYPGTQASHATHVYNPSMYTYIPNYMSQVSEMGNTHNNTIAYNSTNANVTQYSQWSNQQYPHNQQYLPQHAYNNDNNIFPNNSLYPQMQAPNPPRMENIGNHEVEYKSVILVQTKDSPYRVLYSYTWNHQQLEWVKEENIQMTDIIGLDRITQRTNRPMSKGEEMMASLLLSQGIKFSREYQIEELLGRYYDFYFIHDGSRYLIEIDGTQHFNYEPDFDKDEQEFRHRQWVDRLKTNASIKYGYKLLRVDYNSLGNMSWLLNAFLLASPRVLLSNPDVYTYLYVQDEGSENLLHTVLPQVENVPNDIIDTEILESTFLSLILDDDDDNHDKIGNNKSNSDIETNDNCRKSQCGCSGSCLLHNQSITENKGITQCETHGQVISGNKSNLIFVLSDATQENNYLPFSDKDLGEFPFLSRLNEECDTQILESSKEIVGKYGE